MHNLPTFVNGVHICSIGEPLFGHLNDLFYIKPNDINGIA